MAITVDWPNSIISVPKVDTVLTGTDPVSGRELRTYDTNLLHTQLRDAGDSEDGRAFAGGGLNTHTYQTNVLGNVTYAPSLFILSPYRVEFEDGTYQVKLTGTNNNIDSVAVVNQVQIVPDNSAGLQIVSTGSGLDASQDTKLTRIHALLDVIENGNDHAELMRLMAAALLGKATGAATTEMKFRDLADTKDRITATVDENGNRSAVTLDPS